ncbi:uncharacterized protein KD926_011352 [Aspergillus affinis]|uniref:uncharacterized protein n=1 Tax=Aspergillus affinis TaxID=1070780 RepID=UPI0022FE75E6|nr:uncharacterized protein KD926_011352 [Aspergillus affinis]KAI9038014.1 hypothetical protein KD926_011352 [Aspergillus affinis]
MGVIRLPRPTALYVPNSLPSPSSSASSSTRTLTPDMISPPLSSDFTFDSETLPASSLPALEYISRKLQQKMMHVTLLVGRGKPYPTGTPSDLMVIPISPLDPTSVRIVHRTVAKGAAKFSLGASWTDALVRAQYERHANEYLIQQSIMQNEVVFSREGLTLLNVDRIYTFKRRLCILSSRGPHAKDEYVGSCVSLLHRTIQDFQGRPFSKAFFHRVYEQLDVRDELLMHIADVYRRSYGVEGIVLPERGGVAEQTATRAPVMSKKKSSSRMGGKGAAMKPAMQSVPEVETTKPVSTTLTTTTTTTATTTPAIKILPAKPTPTSKPLPAKPTSTVRSVRKSPLRGAIRSPREAGPPRSRMPTKRGPKTPQSASDVTPITRNEWNMLVGTDFKHVKPTVTKWTPSPTVLAAA